MCSGSNEIYELHVIHNGLFTDCGVLDRILWSKDKDVWSEDKDKDLQIGPRAVEHKDFPLRQ